MRCSDATGNSVETCGTAGDDEDCDGYVDEHLNSNPSCSPPTLLGSLAGDVAGATLTAGGTYEQWFRVTIGEQDASVTPRYLSALVSLDPLIKMALLHHQFESIHPFYDGNGRTGRILCVLYLVQQRLLDIPVLYLSRHIVRTKADYYRLLQEVRERDAWEGETPTRAEIEAMLGGDEEKIALVFEDSIADVLDRYIDDERIKTALYGKYVYGDFSTGRIYAREYTPPS